MLVPKGQAIDHSRKEAGLKGPKEKTDDYESWVTVNHTKDHRHESPAHHQKSNPVKVIKMEHILE